MSMHRARKQELGQSLISVIVSAIVLLTVSVGILTALTGSFKSTKNSTPQTVGELSVSNVQTDLAAMSMYDQNASNTISHLTPGKTITLTPPAPVASGYYPQADRQPTVLTVQSVAPGANGGVVTVQTLVPGGQAAPATVNVMQRAPVACDPNLANTTANTGC